MALTDTRSRHARPPIAEVFWRIGWKALGFAALGLGALGIVLPLLPTTPLVILATFAFAKSSPALHDWLLKSRHFGPIIADWQKSGVIALRYKCLALTMMSGAIALSAVIEVPTGVLAVQILCISLAAGFILTRPSRAPAEMESVDGNCG